MAILDYSDILDKINLDTYEVISKEFSDSRAYVWQCIKDFTPLITPNSHVLEIGCGNGKNMQYILKNIDCNMVGIDTCQNFVNMCKENNLEVYNNSIFYNVNLDSKKISETIIKLIQQKKKKTLYCIPSSRLF
jgi:SAM-dependent methyltransferase